MQFIILENKLLERFRFILHSFRSLLLQPALTALENRQDCPRRISLALFNTHRILNPIGQRKDSALVFSVCINHRNALVVTEQRDRVETVIHQHWSSGTQGQILNEFGSESAAKWILTKTHQDSDSAGLSAQKG